MKKTIATLLAGAAVAFAVPASAQVDDNSPFTGFRAQGVVGYDVMQAGSSTDDERPFENDESAEGVIYGASVGYDIDMGGLVVGPEAEFTFSSTDVTLEDGDEEGFGLGNVSAERDLYLGARVGARVGDSALAYVKGGYTNATFNTSVMSGANRFNEGFDTDGYRLGAGVEVALSQNMFVNAEYRYSNYSEAEVDFVEDIPDSSRFDIDLDRHQVAVGLGIRF